ncbi:MAG: GNAT family protein [Thermodesulfobacteriota bacterium]
MENPIIERQDSYSVFIEGEVVDLCVPSTLAIQRDGWADWFNDQETTKYLDHGLFPNMVEDQIDFYETLRQRKRLALLIRPKNAERAIGVISLSNINMFQRSAQGSIVIGERAGDKNLFALESFARITSHAFEVMGLERIYAGQVFPGLKNWNKRMELLGYKAEGINRKGFVRGHSVFDTISLSCLYEDYLSIKRLRKGNYWLGQQRMLELVDTLPEHGFAEILHDSIAKLRNDYFSTIQYV